MSWSVGLIFASTIFILCLPAKYLEPAKPFAPYSPSK